MNLKEVPIEWKEEKNEILKNSVRKVSFEMVEKEIRLGKVIDIIFTPNQVKYPNQLSFIISLHDYIHYVPFEVRENVLNLITIIPSQKLNKQYNLK